MKKILHFFSAALFCILLCFGVTACGVVQNFNVSFMVDGEVYHTIETTGAEAIVIPENPTKEGFIFDGWYWDNDVWEKPFTTNSLLDAPISSDMKVYAKFKSAHEHAFTDYVSDNNATYEADGTKTAKCNGEGCTETDTVPDVGSKLKSHITFKTLKLEGNTASGKVANGTTTFAMQDEVEVHGTVSYQVFTQAQENIPTKICAVSEGDNTFYVVAIIDGQEITYTVNVRVKPLYTVNFNYWDGVLDTQEIEEDGFAVMPEVPAVNVAYNVVCDYDVTDPITDDTEIAVEKQVKDEMKIFTFSEVGLDACTISAVKSDYWLSVKELVVPNYVTSITSTGWALLTSLEKITLPFVGTSATATSASYNTLFGAIFGTTKRTGSVAVKQYYSSSNYQTYYLPSTLKSVTITGGNLYYGAFYNCSSLTSVTLGDNVKTVGGYAFYECSGLTSVTLPNGITGIGFYAFCGCSGLTSIAIPETVKSIGSSAFENCSGLTSVVIPDSVEEIGDSAFRACSRLTHVTIGSGVTGIGDYAFASTTRLVDVYNRSALPIEAGSTSYGNVGKNALNVYTEAGGGKLFTMQGGFICYADDTESLYYLVLYVGTETEVTVPANIRGNSYEIYNNAFRQCDSLTSVVIGDGVKAIGREAFYMCDNLIRVTLGSGLESIGYSAFSHCDKLLEVYNRSALPIAVGNTDYGEIGKNAKNVYTDTEGSSKLLTTSDGFICYVDTATEEYYLVGYVGTQKAITLPDKINGENYAIYKYAFDNREDLTSIVLPDGLTGIGDYAFYHCSGLTTIDIPDSVESIGSCAFMYCRGLTTIDIPDNVDNIGSYAFYSCTELTSVTIGINVTSIKTNAFANCAKLTRIDYQGTIAQWNAITKGASWDSDAGNYTVYCTNGTI